MSNKPRSLYSSIPSNLLQEVNEQNHAIISLVGAHLLRLRASHGYSDRYIASRAGCSHVTIWHIRRGTLKYCGISLLTKICAALGCDLLDWLRSPVPGEAEMRAEVEKKAGVFGK